MDTSIVISAIVMVVAVIIATVVVVSGQRMKSQQKRYRIQEAGTVLGIELGSVPGRTEAVQVQREKRIKEFDLRPLAPAERTRYFADWTTLQRGYADDPSTAVTQADKLLTTMMAARGCSVSDFERRSAAISPYHPTLVQNYRLARDLSLRHVKGESSTEDLRRAMVCFRLLFDELLETPGSGRPEENRERLAS